VRAVQNEAELGMDRLNEKQRRVVWVAIALAVVMFLFPPVIESFLSIEGDWGSAPGGYSPIWENSSIDYGRLLIQYVLLAVVTWAVVTGFRNKPEQG
jgi:hypothetical protein